ncbi:MAG: hypothetical protein Q8922_10370 [Bacteroidota bacterium]|nr:hypothetical protein [Bacteroidota bacterium]MDP4234594.1 hypothetical protein [Bacteroidota bacterium]MDP4243723.1 hypothetical protein [Bacteroidota bacterium]MDP4288329.1 hypothetical protein [Bacteroidota bacterium]
MTRYLNRNGNSGVTAFEIEPEGIWIQFRGGTSYLYPASRVGFGNFQTMCGFATRGQGLGTFINTTPTVKNGYTLKR